MKLDWKGKRLGGHESNILCPIKLNSDVIFIVPLQGVSE